MAGPTSVQRVPLHDLIEAEQARYVHRTVPTAALGAMLVAGLVAVVFHSVVSSRSLYLWEGAMVVLTTVRMIGWWRYRGSDFNVRGREWLRQATFAAFVGGIVWGAGSLFLFP